MQDDYVGNETIKGAGISMGVGAVVGGATGVAIGAEVGGALVVGGAVVSAPVIISALIGVGAIGAIGTGIAYIVASNEKKDALYRKQGEDLAQLQQQNATLERILREEQKSRLERDKQS